MAEGYTVSRLQVILEGITGKFDGALKRSESRLKTFSRSMETFNKILTLGGAAIVFNKVAQTLGRIQDAYLAIDKSSPWAREYRNVGTYQANIQDAMARLDEAGGRLLVAVGPQLAKISSFWSEVANSIAKAASQGEAFSASDPFKGMNATVKSLLDAQRRLGKSADELERFGLSFIALGEAQYRGMGFWEQLSQQEFLAAEETKKLAEAIKNIKIEEYLAHVRNATAIQKETVEITKLVTTTNNLNAAESTKISAEKASIQAIESSGEAYRKKALDTEKSGKATESETAAIKANAAAHELLTKAVDRARGYTRLKEYEAQASAELTLAKYFGNEEEQVEKEKEQEILAQRLQAYRAVDELLALQVIAVEDVAAKRAKIDTEANRKILANETQTQERIRQERWKTAQSAVQATGSLIGSLADLSEAYDRHSKRDFERTKKLRYAEAVVNTAAAIISIWAQGSEHWAVKVLQTAAVAASCAANLKRISDMQYDGGGGGGSTAAAAASAAAGAEGGGATSTAAPRQTVLVQGAVGGMISIDMLRELFADAARRGVVIDQIDIVAGRRRAA
jgi:chemotaxis protein histidine kinase CheA